MARWLRWGPAARWFRYRLVRQASRYLLEPLLIGLAFALPLIGIADGLGLDVDGFPTFLIALGFLLGSEVIGLENAQERPDSRLLRQAEAQLEEILESSRAVATNELGFALRERGRAAGYEQAEVAVVKVEAATAALDVRVALYPFGPERAGGEPIQLDLRFDLRVDELQGAVTLAGPVEDLGPEGRAWLEAEAGYFLERAGAATPESGQR